MNYSIIGKDKADALRKQYTDRYADKTLRYRGYLWEVIRGLTIIDRKTALELLESKDKVFVMWDNRTMQNVAQRIAYPFPADMMFSMQAKDLSDQLKIDFNNPREKPALPTELYIFDQSMKWTIIFTHESDQHTFYNETVPRWDILCMTNLL